jgi:hypothetical protein
MISGLEYARGSQYALSQRHIVPFYAETVHLKDGVCDFLQTRIAVCSKSWHRSEARPGLIIGMILEKDDLRPAHGMARPDQTTSNDRFGPAQNTIGLNVPALSNLKEGLEHCSTQ